MARANGKTSRSTGTSARGARSRAAIIKAASPLFAGGGFRGTSMASVAAAADLTQPGLLHHFPSKEALLHEVLDQHYHEDGRRLNEGLEEEGDLLTALESIVEHNRASEDAARLFTVLVAEGLSDEHPAHEFFVERYEKVRRRLAARLRTDQQGGRLPEHLDADALARVLVAVMDGLQTQWLLDPSFDMVSAFRAFVELLRHDGGDASGSSVDPGSDG
jgi:AcrR family transcriptional regulator